jgi:hypothetical protein
LHNKRISFQSASKGIISQSTEEKSDIDVELLESNLLDQNFRALVQSAIDGNTRIGPKVKSSMYLKESFSLPISNLTPETLEETLQVYSI